MFDEDSHNSVKAAIIKLHPNGQQREKKKSSFKVHAIKVALDKHNVDKVNAKSKPYNLSHIAAGNSFSCCVKGKALHLGKEKWAEGRTTSSKDLSHMFGISMIGVVKFIKKL